MTAPTYTLGRWYSTPTADRHRAPIKVCLPPDVREALDAAAAERGVKRSRLIEELVRAGLGLPQAQEK